MSAVLSQEPKPLEGLPHDLEKTILRCLRKDPAKRFQHMDDVCVALEELKEESDSGKLGAVAAASRSPVRRRAAYGAAAILVLLAAAVAAWRWGVPREPVTPPRLVPLTTFPGYELHPAFSPDGKQVAFSWNGPEEENYDIYVMLLGTSTPVRLTTHAADDFGPAWSPDGRRIAFWRAGSPPSIMLMSALGGSERELATGSTRRDGVAWSPDGKFVAYPADPETDGPARIVMVSPDTGERRALTAPPPGRHGDGVPRFSPDGKSLAFVREREDGFDELRTASLAAPLVSARLVSPTAARVYSVPFAWTRDGRGLVFSASYTGTTGLWRMPADGRTPPVPVLGVGQSPEGVDIAQTGALLAFGESLSDVNLWKLGLDGRRVRSGPSRAIASTAWDGAPDYAPDGRRVVFVSNRSGTYEIWVSDADGSNQTRVTHLAASMSGSPRWSPDGKTIAFDSQAEGQEDIYTVSADGGPAKRLTHSPSLDVVATWSRDGRWIYFTSDRSGSRQIWKMPAEGGDPVQVTRHGGVNATESIDGGTLYYARDIDAPGFCRMPVGGGNEEQFLDIPARRRWGQVALTAEGLFYLDVDGTDTSSRSAIFFHDFSTRTSTLVQRLAGPAPTHTPGLALSPDGRSLLFLQLEASGSDLKLLENFR
jgi:Tol biopolymer transport system component